MESIQYEFTLPVYFPVGAEGLVAAFLALLVFLFIFWVVRWVLAWIVG